MVALQLFRTTKIINGIKYIRLGRDAKPHSVCMDKVEMQRQSTVTLLIGYAASLFTQLEIQQFI